MNLRDSIHQDVEQIICVGGCGGPGWRRVAYLNMSDTTQTCPQNWSFTDYPKRSCMMTSNGYCGYYCYSSWQCYSYNYCGCRSAFFSTHFDVPYSQVCGRIIGYQYGLTSAFVDVNSGVNVTIDDQYVFGVSLTHGNPRQHIWTFAAALYEGGTFEGGTLDGCQCTDTNFKDTIITPSFVVDDYLCETGVYSYDLPRCRFYAYDQLWDGQGCGLTSTCCTYNNPPWFCKQLPQSTSDDLEIRLCGCEYGHTPLELIEIYVH